MRIGVVGAGVMLVLLVAAPARAVRLPGVRVPCLAGGRDHPGKSDGKRPGYLGVVLQELNAPEAAQLGVRTTKPMGKGDHVVVVRSVDRDAPAAGAGLHPLDVLLAINGKKTETIEEARHELKNVQAGSRVELRMCRDGSEQRILVEMGDEEEIERVAAQRIDDERAERGAWPTAAAFSDGGAAPPPAGPVPLVAGSSPGHGIGFLGAFSLTAVYTGLDVDGMSTQLAEFFGVHDGIGLLVRTVSENSPGAAAGLKAGDVIERVNNQPVVSRMDWMKQMHANRGRAVQLAVMRNHREMVVTLAPGAGKG